jgi:hypothetical protein
VAVVELRDEKGMFRERLVCLAVACLQQFVWQWFVWRLLILPNAIALHNCDDLRVHAFTLLGFYSAVLRFHSSHGGEHTSTGDEYEV